MIAYPGRNEGFIHDMASSPVIPIEAQTSDTERALLERRLTRVAIRRVELHEKVEATTDNYFVPYTNTIDPATLNLPKTITEVQLPESHEEQA